MTDFGHWQREVNKSGLVLCVGCFETKNPSLMFKDEDGDIWDVCLDCHERDSRFASVGGEQ